ncbi:MAG: AMP-binding protein, partial [Proteobacteria bacterium]|nr:AMP-binding protein [Pseudomonadota bacterium]
MSGGGATLAEGDSFPKLLISNAKHRGARPAMREKEFGIWQCWTWAEVLDEVRALACGLAAEGLKRGDKLAIIGDNRPQLYWSMVAAQAIGAVPVPMYQDSIADELAFVLSHAEARFAIVEDQEQVDKLLEIRRNQEKPGDTGIEKIFYKDIRGMRNYGEDFMQSIADLQAAGRAYDAENPEFFAAEVAKGGGGDLAIM